MSNESGNCLVPTRHQDKMFNVFWTVFRSVAFEGLVRRKVPSLSGRYPIKWNWGKRYKAGFLALRRSQNHGSKRSIIS